MESFLFHPKVVHLPIALAVLMPLVCAGLLFAWMSDLLPRRAWIIALVLQVVLVGSSFVAMRSGETEEETVEAVVAEAQIEAHEEAAEVFTWTAATALLFFAGALLFGDPLGRKLAMMATASSLLVLALGYRAGQGGGALVYQHGAAAAYTSAAGTAGGEGGGTATPAAVEEDDDDD